MGWSVNATTLILHPRERDPVPFVEEAVWAPSSLWTDAENLVHTGIRLTVQPVGSPYTG
jgi:hypothetical protein